MESDEDWGVKLVSDSRNNYRLCYNEKVLRAFDDERLVTMFADAYGFLLSEYESPKDVSLGKVFYMGAGLNEEASNDEASAYLKATGQEEIYTTLMKLDKQKVYDLLGKRLELFVPHPTVE